MVELVFRQSLWVDHDWDDSEDVNGGIGQQSSWVDHDDDADAYDTEYDDDVDRDHDDDDDDDDRDDDHDHDDDIERDHDHYVQHREKQLLLTQSPALVSFTGL